MSIDKFNPHIPALSQTPPTSVVAPSGFEARASGAKNTPELAQGAVTVSDSFGGIDTGRTGYYASKGHVPAGPQLAANRIADNFAGLHAPPEDVRDAFVDTTPLLSRTLPALSLFAPALAGDIMGPISAGIMAA